MAYSLTLMLQSFETAALGDTIFIMHFGTYIGT